MVIFTSSLCYVLCCKPVIRLLNADLFNPLKAPTFNTRRVFAPFHSESFYNMDHYFKSDIVEAVDHFYRQTVTR